jgi:hypothetical protein
MSAAEISKKTGLSKNELNMAYDNNELNNILLSYNISKTPSMKKLTNEGLD